MHCEHVETECTNTYLYINTDTTHLRHKDHKKGTENENPLHPNHLYTAKKLRARPHLENVFPEGGTSKTGRRPRRPYLRTNRAETATPEEDSNPKFSRQLWNKSDRPRPVCTSLN